ncbi:MAG: putative toxin-antitoxin system toxin component, PIN family [Burkholderiales bacterium]|nr:putative toxin-antitoxin system toxin component, PIN family [Burkholderiales bacterium]
MSRRVRVVLDTSVVVSALVFPRGPAARLREAWQTGRITPLVSRPTVEELARVLAYPKFRLSEAERLDLLADYLPWAETVQIPDPPPAVPRCRDQFDQPFLELAVAARADALVRGDADLLALAGRRGLPPVVSLTALMSSLGRLPVD